MGFKQGLVWFKENCANIFGEKVNGLFDGGLEKIRKLIFLEYSTRISKETQNIITVDNIRETSVPFAILACQKSTKLKGYGQ